MDENYIQYWWFLTIFKINFETNAKNLLDQNRSTKVELK